jgi:NarL family two-component system response regulator LiaR
MTEQRRETEPIRVLLVDDHTMVRQGLATFLKVYADLELAGESASVAEAVQVCAEIQPDVVLMDLVLPDGDGIEATRIIRERFPHVQVIALTSFRDETLVRDVLQAGAIGYLIKNVLADELAAAIRAADAGRPTLGPEATQVLLHVAAQPPTSGQNLTPREREVLRLMIKGLNNTAIAGQLVVSPATIKTHVSSILAKLGVASRTEAVALAVEHHLIP